MNDGSAQTDPEAGRKEARRSFGVSLYGVAVEYALHCTLWLVKERHHRASSKELAELQGVPAAMLAKIMPKLERAGIVNSRGGISGGYALERPATDISVLDVVDAVEGGRRLFDCKEVRRGCILFGGRPPGWSIAGTCTIHAVMLRAEKQMRAELARTTLADLTDGISRPAAFDEDVSNWLRQRRSGREVARLAGVKAHRRT